MKKSVFKLFISSMVLSFLLVLLFAISVHATPPVPSDYTLVPAYSDEFNSPTLDTAKWMYREGPRFWGNNTPDNVSIVNDLGKSSLAFKVDKAADLLVNSGVPFTCGGVISKQLVGYGYYEISARLWNAGPGFHMFFWNMGINDIGNLPIFNQVNEIDMFEIDSAKSTNLAANLHYYVPSPIWLPGGQNFNIGDTSSAYYTYGFEWLPDKVNWYFDGNLIRTYSYLGPHGLQNLWLTGQQLTGDVNEQSTTQFPGYMYIDYFKYYKKIFLM